MNWSTHGEEYHRLWKQAKLLVQVVRFYAQVVWSEERDSARMRFMYEPARIVATVEVRRGGSRGGSLLRTVIHAPRCIPEGSAATTFEKKCVEYSLFLILPESS